jgi:hypothetical protein
MARAMQKNPLILEWATPLIFDCLSGFYVEMLPAANGARASMIERHFTLWCALIQGDLEHLRADLHLLAVQADQVGTDFLTCCLADRHVAGEILDTILRRFRRMPGESRANNEALLALLTLLQTEEIKYVAPERQARAA